MKLSSYAGSLRLARCFRRRPWPRPPSRHSALTRSRPCWTGAQTMASRSARPSIAAILDTSASPRPAASSRARAPRSRSRAPRAAVSFPICRSTSPQDSAKVSPEAQQQLAALARAMQFPRLQDLRFEIAGHTDARGSEQMNQLLSQRRAACRGRIPDARLLDRTRSPGGGRLRRGTAGGSSTIRLAARTGGSRCGRSKADQRPRGQRFPIAASAILRLR